MKKVNFNSLEGFEVPEEWIEKAVNAKPKKKPLLLRPYVWGTAASVVLVSAASLLLLSHLKPPVAVPVAVSTTVATEAATAAYEPTAAVEKPTQPKTVPATESKTEPSTAQTEPVETEPETKPATEPQLPTVAPTDDLSKFCIKEKWYVDTSAVRPDATANAADTLLILSQDELFTGNITVIVSPDSPFYERKAFRLDVTGEYSSDAIAVGGEVILEPVQGENGEKTVTFNLFNEGAYTPSTDYLFLFYNLDENGSKTDTKTLTEPLYSNNSITITI